ncbi:MAG: TetR/AcrR family transcriptional regulator [Chloroflexi bacterium]|nr:TetR/AcrR family transcriptional regulator [Chloroflexota bacterium]
MNARRDRRYDSPLRRDQANATRERILDALVEVIATGGLAELDVPAVAAKAQVSVPTVYRHFGNKQGLIEALGRHVAEKTGLGFWSEPMPRSHEEFVAMVRKIYSRVEEMEPTLRVAMATELGSASRRAIMPERLRVIEATLAPLGDWISPQEFRHLRDVMLILCSSVVVRAFKDYLGYDAARASEIAIWAIDRLLQPGGNHEQGES